MLLGIALVSYPAVYIGGGTKAARRVFVVAAVPMHDPKIMHCCGNVRVLFVVESRQQKLEGFLVPFQGFFVSALNQQFARLILQDGPSLNSFGRSSWFRFKILFHSTLVTRVGFSNIPLRNVNKIWIFCPPDLLRCGKMLHNGIFRWCAFMLLFLVDATWIGTCAFVGNSNGFVWWKRIAVTKITHRCSCAVLPKYKRRWPLFFLDSQQKGHLYQWITLFLSGIFGGTGTSRADLPSQLPAQGREINRHSHAVYSLRCIFMSQITSRDTKRFVSHGFCHCAWRSLRCSGTPSVLVAKVSLRRHGALSAWNLTCESTQKK